MPDANSAPKKTNTVPRTVAELQEFLKSIPGDYELCFLLGDCVPYTIGRAKTIYRNDDWEMVDFLIEAVDDGTEA